MEVFLFWIFAVVGMGCGFLVVWHRNPMNSAIYLVITMLCLAGLYVLLMSGFVATIQILIYAGAVMVLMLFVIMMLNLRADSLQREGSTRAWLLAGVVGLVLVFRIAGLFSIGDANPPAAEDFGTIEAVGASLFSTYLLPFELAAVLLLIAVIGAVILAKRTTP
jgi:NADH-quinone oxidoreductase subunit J